MSETSIPGSKSPIIKLLVAGVIIAFVISALLVIYTKSQREKCDKAAEKDLLRLRIALERFHMELEDMGCSSKWEYEEKLLTFFVGPYYAWSGTNRKCKVKLRFEGDQVWGCSRKGIKLGNDGANRNIYRIKLRDGSKLPATTGPCTGQSYEAETCFTESVVNDDCSPKYDEFGFVVREKEKVKCNSLDDDFESALREAKELVRTSVNNFSIALYKSSVKDTDNYFFGPLTAYVQFFTTAEITKGLTRKEILQALNLEDTNPGFRNSLETLIKDLRCAVIEGDGSYAINDVFCVGLEEILGKKISGNDFFRPLDTQLVGSSKDNGSVEKESECIPGVILTDPYRIKFAVGWKNITKFSSKWAKDIEFDPVQTEDEDFYTFTHGQVKATMMKKRVNSCRYVETDKFQILEAPYDGKGISMLILLPKEKLGIPELEEQLSSKNLDNWLGQLRTPPNEIEIWLPRFEITGNTDFENSVKTRGIKRLFNAKDCRFNTEIIPLFQDNPVLEEALVSAHMANMSQKAWIEVDEKGTEAYVVGVNCAEISAEAGLFEEGGKQEQIIKFHADHPFMFIVRHNDSGAIVFMGRLMNP